MAPQPRPHVVLMDIDPTPAPYHSSPLAVVFGLLADKLHPEDGSGVERVYSAEELAEAGINVDLWVMLLSRLPG